MERYSEFTDMIADSNDPDDHQVLLDACAVYRDQDMLSQMLEDGDLAPVALALLPHLRFVDVLGEAIEAPAIKVSASGLKDNQEPMVQSWNRVKLEVRVHDSSRELVQALADSHSRQMVEVVCMVWEYQKDRQQMYGKQPEVEIDPAADQGGQFGEWAES